MRRRTTGRDKFERIAAGRPGDEVLRRRVRTTSQLRLRPALPGILQFAKVMLTETPLVLMMSILMMLTAIVASGIFFLERAANENVDTYLDTVWWSMSSFQTQGNPWRPVTFWGSVVAGAWTVIGTMLFWGTIIASVTVFFMRRRERTESEIITTIQRNLDDLDDLTLHELELLKESADNVINLQIEHAKARNPQRR